jgi:hypothetical protein
MRRIYLAPILILLAAVALAESRSIKHGVIEGLPEASGAAAMDDNRLLIVGDEDNSVALLKDAGQRLDTGRIRENDLQAIGQTLSDRGVKLNDIEDVAWDRDHRYAFVITSHSRNKRGKNSEKRYQLARLSFAPDGSLMPSQPSPVPLTSALVSAYPFLAEPMKRTAAQCGFNIEGAAYAPPGHLLLGLRSPTLTQSEERANGFQEDALILRLTNPQALFDAPGTAPAFGREVTLDLHGSGIRGMTYDSDRKGCWLIAGLSPDPNDDAVESKWHLWFWDERNPARRVPADEVDLKNPEGVCLLKVSGQPHLLLVEDAKPSRYALFPAPP